MTGLLATIAVACVALLQASFMVLEMFLWTHPAGRRVFRQSAEQAAASRLLAANLGLYNGFLAAGLAWGLARGDAGREITLFCLGCVLVAGLYGAATASRRILLVQALPAALALLAVLVAGNGG